MFILEESNKISGDKWTPVDEFETEEELKEAMRLRYRVRTEYYQRREFKIKGWTVIDYGSYRHFFRYKEIKNKGENYGKRKILYR